MRPVVYDDGPGSIAQSRYIQSTRENSVIPGASGRKTITAQSVSLVIHQPVKAQNNAASDAMVTMPSP